MKSAIRVRTAKFLLTQVGIIIGIMAAFLVLVCVFFVRNAAQWRLHNIEEDLKVFAEQAARSGEVPRRGDLGAYTFFIIGTDGRYILPRLPRMDDSEKVWEEYELKLRYEMQKRRDGWSYYPEKKRWDLRTGQYVLRYIFVEKTGWIVAVEAYLPGMLSLLKDILTPALFFWMALIAGTAFVLMGFNANWHFHRIVRALIRSQDNNFIDAESIVPPVKPLSRTVIKAAEEKLPVMGGPGDSVIAGPAHRALEGRSRREEIPVERAAELPKAEGRARPPESLLPARPAAPVSRSADDLGAVSIDTADIRSSVLRKAIEELRETKK